MTEQQPTTSTHSVTAISLKLPEFWPSDPQLWFAQAEALFDAQGITTEKTKFGHVVRVLPAQYASEVFEFEFEFLFRHNLIFYINNCYK